MTAPETRVELGGLLAHPDWSAVRVLAGPGHHSTTPVLGVRLVADLHADTRGCAGRLLAVMLDAARHDWHLDALLRRAAADTAAAVLLTGDEPLQPASRMLADRIGLPVLGAQDPLAATMTLNRLVHEPDQVLADLVTRTVTTCTGRSTGPVSGGDADTLVAELAALWRRPVWLLDPGGRVISGPEPGTGDRDTLEHELGARAAGARLVVAASTGLAAERRAMTAALAVAGESMARRLTEQRLAVERDARLRTTLLAEVLQGHGELPALTRRRAVDAGWSLDGWHVGVRLDIPEAVDPVATRPDVQRAADQAHLRAVVVEQGSGWALWTTFEHEPEPHDLQRHGEAARRTHRSLREALPCACGVGRAHPGLPGLVRTLGEAGDAARLATGRAAAGYFVHVDRMGLGQMLLAWTRTDTFLPAARSLLAPLDDQDATLRQTLATYLDAESSITETAAVLDVHRNTVTARIARIRELLDVDLTDPDERLALHLACRSVQFHG